MATLGQSLQVLSVDGHKATPHPRYTAEEVATLEAARVKVRTDSLFKVTEQAKQDIARAIAKREKYRIESRIPESEPAYAILLRLGLETGFGRDQPSLEPVWNSFLTWAASEELCIDLASCRPDIVNGEPVGGFYICIRAFPSLRLGR